MLLLRVGIRLPTRSIGSPRLITASLRFKTSLPENFNPQKDLPSKGEWKHLKQHIPGESIQTNELTDRMPRFPLAKEIVPTLLPRPGVPQVGKEYTFRQVVLILKNKKAPELVYESEPHRLYFLMTFCFGLVFVVYGVMLAEFTIFQANKDYKENERNLPEPLRKREWVIDILKNGIFSAVCFTAAYWLAKFPTRLVRRMWYLPGPVEHIRFTSYPLLPGRPTPIITVPLENLVRNQKAKVWTGKGFYGTADNSMFYFVLKEKGAGKSWVVDRKGFFWSDGRVFDYLFGKESLTEAEAGIPYDAKVGIINKEVAKKRKQLRQEHGFFYKWKLGAEEVKSDISKASDYVKELRSGLSGLKKALPKGQKNDKRR